MNTTQKGILIVIAILIVVMIINKTPEKYRTRQIDYRYGLIDTNPTRRVGQFFDTCSPENMEDCKRNNPYEGLPYP